MKNKAYRRFIKLCLDTGPGIGFWCCGPRRVPDTEIRSVFSHYFGKQPFQAFSYIKSRSVS